MTKIIREKKEKKKVTTNYLKNELLFLFFQFSNFNYALFSAI